MKDFSDYEIMSGAADMLDRIKPMWEALRDHHANGSKFFSDQMRSTTFDFRRKRFEQCASTNGLLIELIWHGPSDLDVGCAISSVEEEDGQLWGCLESLYVVPEFRGRQIGSLLTRRSLDWIRNRHCERITLSVAEGNESVYNFYRKFGFEVRHSSMEIPSEDKWKK
jgi:GNAT superfamily N-acetyltransferase